MNRIIHLSPLLMLVFLVVSPLAAQPLWQIRAGYVMGAATPAPFPAEIREVKGFDPDFGWIVGGGVAWAVDSAARWQVGAGISVSHQGMTTRARVKNYGTELRADDGTSVKGVWTGVVETEYQTFALSPDVVVRYALSPRWNLGAGIYASYLADRHFGGIVYDGYFRKGDPTGEKAVFAGGNTQSYCFDNDLRRWQWGVSLMAEWRWKEHVALGCEVSYGLSDIFRSDFETVTFAMHPFLVSLSAVYLF